MVYSNILRDPGQRLRRRGRVVGMHSAFFIHTTQPLGPAEAAILESEAWGCRVPGWCSRQRCRGRRSRSFPGNHGCGR